MDDISQARSLALMAFGRVANPHDSKWQLLPPCCHRGSSVSHLFFTEHCHSRYVFIPTCNFFRHPEHASTGVPQRAHYSAEVGMCTSVTPVPRPTDVSEELHWKSKSSRAAHNETGRTLSDALRTTNRCETESQWQHGSNHLVRIARRDVGLLLCLKVRDKLAQHSAGHSW